MAAEGGALYVSAEDATGKPALWKSNGTDAGTTVLKTFNAKASTSPYYHPATLTSFVPAGSKLYFTANDATTGPALWVTDGTGGGTKQLKSLPSPTSSYSSTLLRNAVAAGSKLYFTFDAVDHTRVLWASDGSTTGTTKLAVLNATYYSGGDQLAVLGGTLYFANTDSTRGVEVWKSGGTVASTVVVKDIVPGAGSSFPAGFAAGGNAVYFAATNGTAPNQLWKTNGTAGGTVSVATLTPAVNHGGTHGSSQTNAILGKTLIFSADDGVHGRELWKSDGTNAGTTLLKDLVPGARGAYPFGFTLIMGKLYFATSSSNNVSQLWVTDGTAAGTKSLKSFTGSSLGQLTAFNGKLAFMATTTSGGQSSSTSSLWISDGTGGGTKLLKSFAGASYDYSAGGIRIFNSKLYFSAKDSTLGFEPWVSDGTAGGTKMLADLNPNGASSNPKEFTVYKSKLYFAATNGVPGAEIWVTDGTTGGTKVWKNFGTNSSQASDLIVAGANFYFFTHEQNGAVFSNNLWKSDGTPTGTTKIFDGSTFYIPEASPVALPNGSILFQVGKVVPGSPTTFQFWVSNGTSAGTKVLKSTLTGTFTYSSPKILNGKLYFTASDTAHGRELWSTDGTGAGTVIVKDLNPGTGSSSAIAVGLLNGRLAVVGDDGIHGNELFIDK